MTQEIEEGSTTTKVKLDPKILATFGWDEIEERIKNDTKSKYLKWKDGEKKVLKFFYNDDNKPNTKVEETYEGKSSIRYHIPCQDVNTGEEKIWSTGITNLKNIGYCLKDMAEASAGTTIAVTRHGSSIEDTEYSLMPFLPKPEAKK